jgi:FAD/FMN-containing dehydrogenase
MSGLRQGVIWRNWGQNQACAPAWYAEPRTEVELVSAVREGLAAGLSIRVAGTGHSSSPLVQTGGLLLSLQHLCGVIDTDVARRRARMWAGTTIGGLGDPLWDRGLALSNQGDIDKQVIAGAIATATHGSGRGLQSFSGAVRSMRLINGLGEIVEITEDQPELMRAAQVSLGALGVVIDLELEVSPAYYLQERVTYPHFTELVEHWNVNPDSHRHFSFLWCPSDDSAELFELPTPAGESMVDRAYTKFYNEVQVDEPDGIVTTAGSRVDRSYRIYPDGFGRIFNELEYFVPADVGREAFLAVKEYIQAHHPDQIFPIEVRWVKADEGYLSPQYRRDTCVITITVEVGTDYWPYLREVDAVLDPFEPRPHWGKMNFMTRERMERLYPELDAFIAIRSDFDPKGVFLNDHLRPLVG